MPTPAVPPAATDHCDESDCPADDHGSGSAQVDTGKEGSVAAMWQSVLVLALVTAADPLRLIATFIIVSRRRPVENLVVYLIGCLIVSAAILLVPLLLLDSVKPLADLVKGLSGPASSGGTSVQPVPIAMGAVALVVAAVITVRWWTHRRSHQLTRTGVPSTAALEDGEQTAVRRALGRLSSAWGSGALWVSLVMGLTYVPAQVSIALAIIATSGAPIGTQLASAMMFIAVMLAAVEIILISCLVAPERTRRALQPLHDWVHARRQQVVAAIFAMVGVSLVVTGTGIV